MTITTTIRQLLTQCKIHGSGEAQVILSDAELYSVSRLNEVQI